jgi:hypothetical protein
MGRSSIGGLVIIGLLLAVLGIAGFIIPEFTTQHTEDVAKVGPVKVEATHHENHFIPPAAAGGALALGIVLIGGGLYQRRS